MGDDELLWAFDFMYHYDKMNACVHCASVKFSPLTFRLAFALEARAAARDEDITAEVAAEVAEVKRHVGAYELDPGR